MAPLASVSVHDWAGDGCFLMNGQELATAAQYDVKVIFIVVNNGMYGTIRMHQEREYPGRVSGSDLANPDFAALARVYGGIGVTVTGQGRGFDVDDGRVALDLRNARVDAPFSFWVKPAGQAASVQFDVARASGGGVALTAIDARGAGLSAHGALALARDNSLVSVDIERLALEGRTDARLTAARASDGGMDIRVTGAMFDAAPFMGGDERLGAVFEIASVGEIKTFVDPERDDLRTRRGVEALGTLAGVQAYQKKGAKVVVTDIGDGSETAAAIGGAYFKHDVTSEDEWIAAIAFAKPIAMPITPATIQIALRDAGAARQ